MIKCKDCIYFKNESCSKLTDSGHEKVYKAFFRESLRPLCIDTAQKIEKKIKKSIDEVYVKTLENTSNLNKTVLRVLVDCQDFLEYESEWRLIGYYSSDTDKAADVELIKVLKPINKEKIEFVDFITLNDLVITKNDDGIKKESIVIRSSMNLERTINDVINFTSYNGEDEYPLEEIRYRLDWKTPKRKAIKENEYSVKLDFVFVDLINNLSTQIINLLNKESEQIKDIDPAEGTLINKLIEIDNAVAALTNLNNFLTKLYIKYKKEKKEVKKYLTCLKGTTETIEKLEIVRKPVRILNI